MVYTNTGFSAHPLANPLNCRQQGNFNIVGYGFGRKSSVRMDHNAKLPDPKMLTKRDQIAKPSSELKVPNQLGPELGGTRLDTIGMTQQHPSLFICLDGTMMDVKSGKVIYDPAKNALASHWNKLKVIPTPGAPGCESWNDAEISQPQTAHNLNSSKILSDIDSARYWKQQAASQKPMSPEQEKLLADLEAGKFMKLSRLEDVDESRTVSK